MASDGIEDAKEFHFHIYFNEKDPLSVESALDLRKKIIERSDSSKSFTAVALSNVNHAPRGPHPIGSYEVWVPIESFDAVFEWIKLNRGSHSVLVHPLTRQEIKDHTERSRWLGEKLDLNLSFLVEDTIEIPLQYPQLGLGYSKKN